MPSKKKSNDINERRDIFGRNISFLLSALPTKQDISKIDLYSCEYESGYTPLHVTLKEGYLKRSFKLYKYWKDEKEYLSYKFGGNVMNQKDREGLNPLELYSIELRRLIYRYPKYIGYRTSKNDNSLIFWEENASNTRWNVKNNFLKLPLHADDLKIVEDIGCTHILTLGSNVNYQLGTGTKDNRQNAFQLNIHQLEASNILLNNRRFKRIFMTRYHFLFLTSDNEVYACGNTGRGRIGNGVIDLPQAHHVRISGLPRLEIKQLSTSDHHTLVLYDTGEVYSWGWNYYCQLGYSTSNKSSDDIASYNICSPLPRKVSLLDHKDIVSIAASKVHSCALTRNGILYIWGLNLGQMGSSKPQHLSLDVEYMGSEGHLILKPLTIDLSHLNVEQVICTEFCTFVRSQGNTLRVFTNYTMRTFKLLLPRSRNYTELDSFSHFTPREIPSNILDMKCKNPYGNNITFRYSCGRIGIINVKEETPLLWSKFSNIPPVYLYWTPGFDFRRCLGMDISAKGGLILCTVGGEVYTSENVESKFEKMHSNKLISGNAINVSCDSQFGSFAISKDESCSIPILYPKDSLKYDFSRYSPIRDLQTIKRDRIYSVLKFPKFQYSDYLSNEPIIISSSNNFLDERKDFETSKYELAEKKDNDLRNINQNLNNEGVKFDVLFMGSTEDEVICKCHKLILSVRCSKIVKSLQNDGVFIMNNGKLELSLRTSFNQKIWYIDVKSSDSDEISKNYILNIIHYLYTDEKPSDQKISRILLELVDNSLHYSKLSKSLNNLLSNCKRENTNTTIMEPDVVIKLKDGSLCAHSLVLSSRSPYLETIIENSWHSLDEQKNIVIDFMDINYITKEHFEIILKYMYGTPYEEILEDKIIQTLLEGVQFLLDLAEISNELNLESFKNFLEVEISKYIDGESVVPLLINSIFYNCKLLTLRCSWFFCANIGILFSKEAIEVINECFTDEIWDTLEFNLQLLKSDSLNPRKFDTWYQHLSVDWINLFRSNIEAFNEKFISKLDSFIPIFDIKTSTGLSKEKTAKRRVSSTQSGKGIVKLPVSTIRSSLTDYIQSGIERRSTTTSWSEYNKNDPNVIEDSEEFVEVKKSKRKLSHQISTTDEPINVNAEDKNTSILIHKDIESVKENLPSLLKEEKVLIAASNEGKFSSIKMTGNFKKNTQKQRMKHLTQAKEERSKKSEKESIKNAVIWGNKTNGQKNEEKTISSSTRKKSLPSLYDSKSPDISGSASKGKNNKLPKNINKDNLYMAFANASQTIPVNAIDAMKAEEERIKKDRGINFVEDELAAAEFEIWFAEESERIQKQLKKSSRKHIKENIEVVYKWAATIPEFLTADEQPKNRKMKFLRKNKTK